MELVERMSQIIKVLNSSTEQLTPKQITTKFIQDPTTSDVATAGHVLKIFHFLGAVGRESFWNGKSVRYRYFKTKNIKVPNGITKRIANSIDSET